MHFISLTAPKHPKKAKRQTKADDMTKAYAAPVNKLEPVNSLKKLRSVSVIIPNTKTIAPPIFYIHEKKRIK